MDPQWRGNLEGISFLGITIQPTTIADLMTAVSEIIGQRKQCIVANHNLHSLYLFHREQRLRNFFRSSTLTHIDGMAMVALARLYGHRVKCDQRVTYVDWTGPLMATAAKNGWRVFYLGSKPGIGPKAAMRLRRRYAGLRIRSVHGYFNSEPDTRENENVLRAIQTYEPHVLMVGMGMPRQELWIHENLSRICANVILPSGAAMDYVAGAVATPPRWAGRLCLAWMFRLISEPKRLWVRYLVEPWCILPLLARDFARRSPCLNDTRLSNPE